jgi:hypothetical protein
MERRIVTEKLNTLIERARTVKMSGEQREQQRRSFAFGNTKIENERITREMVDQQAETLQRRTNG